MPLLNTQSPVPLYFQLKEHLKVEIIAGRLKEGDRLPPERDLAAAHAISRMTARQALQELEREGYLTRQSGRGTFVTGPGNALRISSRGFTRDLEARGLRPGSRILSCTEEPATAVVAGELGVPSGAPVVRLERVRLSEGEPIAHQLSYLSAARFPGLSERIGPDQSLYQLLSDRYGVVRGRGGRQTVESIVAEGMEAELLGVRPGAPLLRMAGSTVDLGGQAVEHGWTVFRADRFKLTVEVV
jgi:GntR family transcriptional regulator